MKFIWLTFVSLVLMGVGPAYGQNPPSIVTHKEVSTKIRAVLEALEQVEIKAKDANVVSKIQATLIWVDTKVSQDLKNGHDVFESKLRECGNGLREEEKEEGEVVKQ